MSLGTAAVLLLMAVLAGATLWHGHFWHGPVPFWARVGLILLGMLGLVLTLLSGMGLL